MQRFKSKNFFELVATTLNHKSKPQARLVISLMQLSLANFYKKLTKACIFIFFFRKYLLFGIVTQFFVPFLSVPLNLNEIQQQFEHILHWY